MRPRRAIAVVAAMTMLASGLAGIAFADTGSNATTVPIITPSNAANPEIQNDAPVQLVVPNGDLPAGQHIDIYECADPTGDITSAFLGHLQASSCDALTNLQYTSTAQGGLTTPDPTISGDAPGQQFTSNNAYVTYSLPNSAELAETNSNATCDLTHECILYIGPSLSNPADGTGVVYSQPFFVNQNYDFLAGSPEGGSGTTTTSSSTTTSSTTTTSSSTTTTTTGNTTSTSTTTTTPPSTTTTTTGSGNVATFPIVTPSNATNPEIQNDEPVQLAIPNGNLTPGTHVDIYECADPTGDLTSTFLGHLQASSCDALTNLQYTANAQGGLTTPDPTVAGDAPDSTFTSNNAYVTYSLPNSAELAETDSNATCDLTHECILYVGPSLSNPSDGPGVVYSQPFFVNQNYDFLAGSAEGGSAPGTPSGVTALAGPDSVTVSWQPPSSDGNAAIKSYVITPYANGVAQSPYIAAPTATSDTVIHLTPGVPYAFTVEAVNRIGPSVPSAPTEPVEPTAPPTPTSSSTTSTSTTTTLVAPSSSTSSTSTASVQPEVSVPSIVTVALHGQVRTEITCGSKPCSGTVRLYGQPSRTAAKAGKTEHAAKKAPLVSLAQAKFSVPPDVTKSIRLTMTAQGKRWLATARQHSPKAQLKIKLADGTALTLSIIVY